MTRWTNFSPSGNKNINGWNVGAFFGDKDFYKD